MINDSLRSVQKAYVKEFSLQNNNPKNEIVAI